MAIPLGARRGLGLVEAVVFSAIGLALLGSVVEMLSGTQASGAATVRTLNATQAVAALEARLAGDLATASPRLAPDGAARLYDIDEGGRVLVIDRVTYRFEPSTGRVTRQVGTSPPERILSASFHAVRFQRVRDANTAALEQDLLQVQLDWCATVGLPAAPGPVFTSRLYLAQPLEVRKSRYRHETSTRKRSEVAP